MLTEWCGSPSHSTSLLSFKYLFNANILFAFVRLVVLCESFHNSLCECTMRKSRSIRPCRKIHYRGRQEGKNEVGEKKIMTKCYISEMSDQEREKNGDGSQGEPKTHTKFRGHTIFFYIFFDKLSHRSSLAAKGKFQVFNDEPTV